MIAWLRAWATTLHIKFFERDLYRMLTQDLDMNEFSEVHQPGDDEMHWTPLANPPNH